MLLLRLGTPRPEKVPQWASVRPCSRSPLHWVLRKWFSYHIVNFFPMKFNIFVLVLDFKAISYCNNFYDWLAFSGKKKKKKVWETFLSPEVIFPLLNGTYSLLLFCFFLKKRGRGRCLCWYTGSLLSPLIPRLSKFWTRECVPVPRVLEVAGEKYVQMGRITPLEQVLRPLPVPLLWRDLSLSHLLFRSYPLLGQANLTAVTQWVCLSSLHSHLNNW